MPVEFIGMIATKDGSETRLRRGPIIDKTLAARQFTTILIRGYDPYDDAIDYGRYLLPLVREEVARRDAEQTAAAAASAEAVPA